MGKAITWIITAAAILFLIIVLFKSGVLNYSSSTSAGAKTTWSMLKTMAGGK